MRGTRNAAAVARDQYGSGPGASRAETQMEEEEISPFETSMDGFLRSNFTSMEQECALLHQPDVGVHYDEK